MPDNSNFYDYLIDMLIIEESISAERYYSPNVVFKLIIAEIICFKMRYLNNFILLRGEK